MASENKIEKPAWMFYFDGPFYDNYLNDLRRLNIAKIQNNLIEESNKNRPSILKHTHPPALFESDQYIHNGIKEIHSLSESEIEWRKRRTNGMVVIAIMLIAGIATATALIMHLVFIEGKDPFEITDLPDDSLHRRRHTTTTILPIITSTVASRNNRGQDDVTTQRYIKDWTTPSHQADDKTTTTKVQSTTIQNDYEIPDSTTGYYKSTRDDKTDTTTQYYSTTFSTTYKETESTTSSSADKIKSITLTSLYEKNESTTLSSAKPPRTTVNSEVTTQYYKTYSTTLSSLSIRTTLSSYSEITDSTTVGDKTDSTTVSDKTDSTTVSSDKTDSTTISDKTDSTNVRSDNTDSTTISSNKTDSTTLSSDKTDSTNVRSDNTDSTNVSDKTDSTTISGKTGSTTISSDKTDSTTLSSNKTDSTTLSSDKTDSTTVSSDNTDSTTVSDKTDSTTISGKTGSTTISSDKTDSTTVSDNTDSTTVSGKTGNITISSDKTDSTTISSDKTDNTTNLSSQNNKINDVIMTQSTTSRYLPSELVENVTSTIKPQSTTLKDNNADEESFNFIILDKAGTTLNVDSGTVISADDSPHTLNNTNVIITAGLETPKQQAQIQVIPETSTSVDLSDPEIFCKYHPADLMMDPTNCARYYNCSDPSIKQGLGVKYLHECRYPRLFKDVQTGCVLFLNVTCAERYEPKAPCEYVQNMCFGDSCEPCEENFPSCVGKENGTIEYSKDEDGSTKYIACFKERTVGQMTCKSGTFDRKTKKCVDPV